MTERRRDMSHISCSFCGKSKREVADMVAGQTVYICSECVSLVLILMAKMQRLDGTMRALAVFAAATLDLDVSMQNQISVTRVLESAGLKHVSGEHPVTMDNLLQKLGNALRAEMWSMASSASEELGDTGMAEFFERMHSVGNSDDPSKE